MLYLRQLALLSLYLFVSLLAACGGDSPGLLSLDEQYINAVDDARIAEPHEISYSLTPINNENPNLIWENGVVGSRLLVVTWLGDAGKYYKCTNPDGCSGNTSCIEGGECPNYRFDSWVTVVPEIKTFFGDTVPEPLRVAQLLGLPPEVAAEGGPREYKYMLEMWVSPQDLFRPCPDPEIFDTACELSFPTDPLHMHDPKDKVMATAGPDYGIFMIYTDWFTYQTNYSYNLNDYPYPWTRLGYTYDWGSSNPVGLSEFVLHGRKVDSSTISVGINSVKTTAEYFME